MSWLHYLLEANFYLAVFYALYFLLFGNETYYKWNRIYLLSVCVASYIIPIIQIGILKPAEVSLQTMSGGTAISLKSIALLATQAEYFSWQSLWVYSYIAGSAIMFVIFLSKLLRLMKLSRGNKVLLNERYKVIYLEDSDTAFSFFNYIYIGTKVSGIETIIKHETAHIDQKHSFDVVFLELIKIISWFNPCVYMLQRSLRTLHEFIADEQTIANEKGDALAYSALLLNNAYGLNSPVITNSFFNYNLLKKRIIMLNKKRSGNLAKLKYLVSLPVCAALLCMSTLGFGKPYGWIDVAPAKPVMANKTVKYDTVYSIVETLPEFPRGMNGLFQYILKNLRYPENARVHKIEGRVIVSFIIEKDGSVNGAKVVSAVSPDLDKEALRVVSSLPKWNPGAQGGKPVRTAYSIPISFKLPPQ